MGERDQRKNSLKILNEIHVLCMFTANAKAVSCSPMLQQVTPALIGFQTVYKLDTNYKKKAALLPTEPINVTV